MEGGVGCLVVGVVTILDGVAVTGASDTMGNIIMGDAVLGAAVVGMDVTGARRVGDKVVPEDAGEAADDGDVIIAVPGASVVGDDELAGPELLVPTGGKALVGTGNQEPKGVGELEMVAGDRVEGAPVAGDGDDANEGTLNVGDPVVLVRTVVLSKASDEFGLRATAFSESKLVDDNCC